MLVFSVYENALQYLNGSRTFPPDGHFPNGHFLNGHFQRGISPMDTSSGTLL